MGVVLCWPMSGGGSRVAGVWSWGSRLGSQVEDLQWGSLVAGLESWFAGSRSLVEGLWRPVAGGWSLIEGLWWRVSGEESMVERFWHLVSGRGSLEADVWWQVSGHMSLTAGLWSWFSGGLCLVLVLGSRISGRRFLVEGPWWWFSCDWSLVVGYCRPVTLGLCVGPFCCCDFTNITVIMSQHVCLSGVQMTACMCKCENCMFLFWCNEENGTC